MLAGQTLRGLVQSRGLSSLAAADATHRFWGTKGDALYCPPTTGLKVDKVYVVHRHGDRAPIAATIGDGRVFKDRPEMRDFWASQMPGRGREAVWDSTAPVVGPTQALDHDTEPFGWLTKTGGDQLEAIGAQLRSRLVDGLGLVPATLPTDPAAVAKIIGVRSTNIRRTQYSAAALLLGLWPLDAREPDAVVPVEVLDPETETMYPLPSCARHKELFWEKRYSLFADAEREWEGTPIIELQRVLADVLGHQPAEELRWATVREVLTCYEVYGLELPAEMQPLQWAVDDVLRFAGWEWAVWYDDIEQTRLAIGRLLGNLLDGLTDDDGPAMQVFSGHDLTLVPLLAAIGHNDGSWPPYASTVVFERATATDDGAHFLRALYNDRVLPITGGDSDGWVALSTFRELLAPYLFDSAEDYEAASVALGTIVVPTDMQM